jgi:tetratricopeptide (TPR) repeat protein
MRRLFHVHASLAEFELAIKALDTYIDIVVNAKDRAEKAAEIGELESDEILLQTVSEGVLLLSCYGAENEARKAKDLTAILEKYIEKSLDPESNASDQSSTVSPKVIAMAYRAIGVGLGNWARWTPVNESRDDIRAEAIENLERSIDPAFKAQNNISTRYALALLYAESRDLDNAILHVRTALSTKDDWAQSTHVSSELDGTSFSREPDLVPLWHLLALLLSAKQEFGVAGRSCEAAFEQFPSTLTAFAQSGRRGNKDKERPGSGDTKKDILRHLRGREKERIIETRMTQIALMEVMDGPEVAVNHSDQLLTLFAALFEDLELEVPQKVNGTQQYLGPPKSASGTVKSFRGSIFGRKKASKAPSTDGADLIPPLPTRTAADPDAPSIQVTDEHHSLHKQRSSQAPKLNGLDGPSEQLEGSENGSIENIGIAVSDIPSHPAGAKQNAKQPLPAVAHNLDHTRAPQPAGHSRQPLEQDVRLPPPHRFESPTKSLTKFPAAQAQKHALAVLVKVWLLISGLYRRASLFEDARQACQEAVKQVEKFETLVAAQDSSARAFSERVWGVYKSSEELWGDVYAERGALSHAQSSPHEAMEFYEEAITRFPDHPRATIGLSNLLLDIWEEKIPAEPLPPRLDAGIPTSLSAKPATNLGTTYTDGSSVDTTDEDTDPSIQRAEKKIDVDPKADRVRYMSRLAARDRAYGLLSMLTKTGSSWDNSEAWFTLSRAYEASSQLEKTKDVLWWCVELEDRKPIRHWWNLGSGSYVL